MKNVMILTALIFTLFSCSKDPVIDPPVDMNQLPTDFKALYNVFDGQGIGAAANISDDIMLFISSDGMQYAWFENNDIKKVASINEEDGLFDGLAFSAIGGLIDYDEERLVAFNKVGGTYQWIDVYTDLVIGGSENDTLLSFSDNTYSLWEWGVDNSCPFDEITAIFGFNKEAEGCSTSEDDDLYLWMANDDGNEVVRYIKDDATFDDSIELEIWRSNSVCGGSPAVFPLNGIGAACVYEPDGAVYQELFFSPDGSKMTILTPSAGTYSEVYDLY